MQPDPGGAGEGRSGPDIRDTCAIVYLRPDPTGSDRHAGGRCPHCHTGTPLPYDQRDQVPTLDDRLTAIHNRLTTA